jgi:hypothetical protein
MKRGMRHGIQSALALTAGLLVGCAAGPRQVRDEGSERIEEAMRPEAHPEVIPEGIVLGDDAPPLAPPGPEVASPSVIEGPYARHRHSRWASGVPVYGVGPVYGPRPHSVRYHLHATPGGSSPGLLP